MMPRQTYLSGTVLITATNGVDENFVGTPSQVTYDGTIYPSEGNPFDFTGGKPTQRRPKDFAKLYAAEPGHIGSAAMIAGNWHFTIGEIYDATECAPK